MTPEQPSDSAPPPRPVDPTGSTDSILERLPRGDAGLRPEGELARGGMGAVEKVRDPTLQRDLVRKVMLPENEEDALSVHRFLEEAQVTAQLDHPGVVPIHQLGRDGDGRLFFTMKLVKGRTLSRIFELVRDGRENWTNTRALELFIRICDTLAFAHQKGVIHRDLKPANIMVGNFGEVYVMDWGLAKVVGDRAEPADTDTPDPRTLVQTVRSADTTDEGISATATGAGYILGTPAYMPLEQAMSLELDARSDIYAVGSMLYELLVGHHPYGDRSQSARDVLVAVMAGAPTPARELNPKLPGEITAICEKAMAREPVDRYQSAGELAQELRNFIEGRVVRTYRTGAFVELKKWVWRNKALAGAIGAAFVLLVVGLIVTRSLYQQAVVEGERAQREAYRAAISAAAAQIENHDYRAAEARLDALPEHLRGWEWRHLRSRTEPSLGYAPLQALAFDQRTGHLLGTRPGRGLLSYDLATGEEKELLPLAGVDTGRRWLSADGRYCITPDGVRDLHTGKVLASTGTRFHPFEPWLINEKKVVDAATGAIVTRPAVIAKYKGQWAMLSPDHKRAALIRGDIVAIVDPASDEQLGEAIDLGGVPQFSCWSPDSALFAAAGWTRRIVVFDGRTGRVHRNLFGRDGHVKAAAFSADAKRLLTSTPQGTQVWDLSRAADPHVLRGHASYVYPVAFSRDGKRVASGGWDGSVGQEGSLRLWDAKTGHEIAKTSRAVNAWWIEFLPDGRLLASFRDPLDVVKLFEADTLREIRDVGPGQRFTVSPDGTRVVMPKGDAGYCVLDLATGETLATLRHGGEVRWGARWIGTADKRGVALWDAKTYARKGDLPGPVTTLDFHGKRVVVAGSSGVARVYDGETKELLAELPGHGREILCVRFSPDGSRILVAGRNNHIHVWDAETYDEIVQLRGHTNYIYSIDFSPDGETLASGSGDGTVRLWGTRPVGTR